MEKNKARGGVVGVGVLGEFQQPIKCVCIIVGTVRVKQ